MIFMVVETLTSSRADDCLVAANLYQKMRDHEDHNILVVLR
jgi:hypothetical protein